MLWVRKAFSYRCINDPKGTSTLPRDRPSRSTSSRPRRSCRQRGRSKRTASRRPPTSASSSLTGSDRRATPGSSNTRRSQCCPSTCPPAVSRTSIPILNMEKFWRFLSLNKLGVGSKGRRCYTAIYYFALRALLTKAMFRVSQPQEWKTSKRKKLKIRKCVQSWELNSVQTSRVLSASQGGANLVQRYPVYNGLALRFLLNQS